MRLAILLMTPALAACGAASSDGSGNSANRGYWESKSTILSLSVNGMALEPEEMPPEATAELETDLGCADILLTSKEAVTELITKFNQAKSCNIVTLEEAVGGVKITGVCDGPDRGSLAQVSDFSALAQQKPDQLLVKTSLRSIVTDQQTNESVEMTAELETMHNRIRGC